MGSTVSIINETNCILNVALRQGTPIYYENRVLPGDVVKRNLGKLLIPRFNLEARLWNGANDYTDFGEIIAPITTVTTATASGIRGIAASVGLVSELVNKEGTGAERVLMGRVILPVGASDSDTKIIHDWITDCVANEGGLYTGQDRTVRIAGGPEAFIDEGKEYQYLENTQAFTILY